MKDGHGPGVGFVAARLRGEPSIVERILVWSVAFNRVTYPSAAEMGRTLGSGFCSCLQRLDLTSACLGTVLRRARRGREGRGLCRLVPGGGGDCGPSPDTQVAHRLRSLC